MGVSRSYSTSAPAIVSSGRIGVAANSRFNETDYNHQVAKFLFSSVQGGVCELVANVNGPRLFELSGSEITASPQLHSCSSP